LVNVFAQDEKKTEERAVNKKKRKKRNRGQKKLARFRSRREQVQENKFSKTQQRREKRC